MFGSVWIGFSSILLQWRTLDWNKFRSPINFKLVAGSRKCSWNVMVDCIRRGHSFFKTSTCLQFRSVSDISNYSSSSTWHIVVFSFNTYELMQTQNMHLCSCLCFPLKWPLWRNMFLVCSKESYHSCHTLIIFEKLSICEKANLSKYRVIPINCALLVCP